MTRYKMATQRIASSQRGFKVHGRPGLQVPQRREHKRFTRQIRREGLATQLGYRDTDPLNADAIAYDDATEIQLSGLDDQAHIAASRLARLHFSNILHDTCKHTTLEVNFATAAANPALRGRSQ